MDVGSNGTEKTLQLSCSPHYSKLQLFQYSIRPYWLLLDALRFTPKSLIPGS